jgi:hypothetical protein
MACNGGGQKNDRTADSRQNCFYGEKNQRLIRHVGCLSLNTKSSSKKAPIAGNSGRVRVYSIEKSSLKTIWRSNSLSNRTFSFTETHQGRRRKEPRNILTNLRAFRETTALELLATCAPGSQPNPAPCSASFDCRLTALREVCASCNSVCMR